MIRPPMLPEQARELYPEVYSMESTEDSLREHLDHALTTIAAMRVEESSRLVDPFTNGGAYEPRGTYRIVSEWRDRNE